jgi:hypothetical protein
MLILIGDASRAGTFGCEWILAWQFPIPLGSRDLPQSGEQMSNAWLRLALCGAFGCTERAFSRTQSTVQYVQLNVNIGISRGHFQVVKFDHPPCGFWAANLNVARGYEEANLEKELSRKKNLWERSNIVNIAVYSPAAYRLALHTAGTDGTEK